MHAAATQTNENIQQEEEIAHNARKPSLIARGNHISLAAKHKQVFKSLHESRGCFLFLCLCCVCKQICRRDTGLCTHDASVLQRLASRSNEWVDRVRNVS